MRKNHDEEIKCKECLSTFEKKSQLKLHMKDHSKEKPYTCDQCSQTFSLKIYYDKHLMKHQVFNCSKCSITVKTRGLLTKHERTHLKNTCCSKCTHKIVLKAMIEKLQNDLDKLDDHHC